MSSFFKVNRDERNVVTLRIVDPRNLNLLNTPVINSLVAELERLGQDDTIRVLILASDGDKTFIGGADLKEMAGLDPAGAQAFIRRLQGLCEAVRRFPAPVIARIQGWCLGGGLEVAAACDLRVAVSGARFAMPEVRMGVPSVIHAALLSRLIGRGRAGWLMLTADNIEAQQALDWGLVDTIAEVGQLDQTVEALVKQLLPSGNQALRAQKALLNTWDELSLAQGIDASVIAFGQAFASGEPAHFMNDFLSKRSTGRRPDSTQPQ